MIYSPAKNFFRLAKLVINNPVIAETMISIFHMSKPNCRCELCTSALECEAERIKDASDALAVALIAHNDGLEESEEAIESLQESLAEKKEQLRDAVAEVQREAMKELAQYKRALLLASTSYPMSTHCDGSFGPLERMEYHLAQAKKELADDS